MQNIDKNNAISHKEYRDIFVRTGLSERESIVYEALLTHGKMRAQALLKLTPYTRTNLYNILDLLVSKGLVEEETESKVILFKPADPYKLATHIYDQKMRYAEADSLLNSVLPGLSDLYKMTTERPVVRVYEGVDGIKELYMDTLRQKTEICAFLTSAESDSRIWKWLRESYAKQRVKGGIRARVIVSKDKKDLNIKEYMEEDKRELRETREVDRANFPCNLEIQIYGDKVSFANYNKKDALFGVIVDNKNIAASVRGLFNLAWLGAQACKQRSPAL